MLRGVIKYVSICGVDRETNVDLRTSDDEWFSEANDIHGARFSVCISLKPMDDTTQEAH